MSDIWIFYLPTKTNFRYQSRLTAQYSTKFSKSMHACMLTLMLICKGLLFVPLFCRCVCFFVCFFSRLMWLDRTQICNICSLFCLFACAFTAFGSSDHLQESLDNIQKLQCFVCLFACLLACLHGVAHPRLDGWDANMQQLKPHWISRHLCFKIGCAPILAWYPFLTVYISNI